MGFWDFAMHFLDETLFQDVVHIDDLPFMGNAHVILSILSFCVARWSYYFTWIIFFFFLLVSFGKLWHESYVGRWGHYGSKIVGVFLRPLSEALGSTFNMFWGYKLFLYGGLCPIYFFRELGFWWLHICALSFIFSIDPFWRSMFIGLKGTPTCFSHAYV